MSVLDTIKFKLSADTTDFMSGMNNAASKLSATGNKMTSLGKGLSLGVTAPILAVGAGIIKMAGDFDEGMASVKAITRATGDEFKALRDLALDLGSTTQFSASEAAAGIEMLAKNGMTIENILSGAAQAALDLAAATGTDLATAADIATDAMSLFKIPVEDMADAVSDITAVTLNSKFSVEDYANALAQAGGMAGKVGVSFADFNTSIAVMADSFKSGADAGTAYKTFIGRLVPQSKEAKEAIEQLGMKFFDSAGNMKPMSEIAQELQTGFKDLSDESKIDLAGTIFGQDAIRAALDLAEAGEAGFESMDKLLSEVEASDVAADKMDNFNGKMKELWSAIERLAIAIADAGLLEWLSTFVEWIKETVLALSSADSQWLKWGVVVGLVVAVLGPLLIVVGAVMSAIGFIGVPIAAAIAGFTALTITVMYFWDELKTAYEWVVALISKLSNSVLGMFGGGSFSSTNVQQQVVNGAGGTSGPGDTLNFNINENLSRSDVTTIAAEAQRNFQR